ncbi:hypothetical protein UCDDS831_g07526 [Diplodia seriata]|uniref:Uncharacterized protein n=1 Tax=Diplodia seriata TaxID=420778 RepID=A0A0G2DXQ0_9PEZI|nr:hypothetical protein UCDDS831_g07526 [Diplodia seriata]
MSTIRNANTTTIGSASWPPADAAPSAYLSALEDRFNDLSLDRSPQPWSPHSCDRSNLSVQLSRSLNIDNDKDNDSNNMSIENMSIENMSIDNMSIENMSIDNMSIDNMIIDNSTAQSAVHPIVPPSPQLRPRSQAMLPPIPSLPSLDPSDIYLTLRSRTRPKANRAKVTKHSTKQKKTTAAAGVTKKKKREEEDRLRRNRLSPELSRSDLRRWIEELRSQRRAREEGMSRARVDGDGGEAMAVDEAEEQRTREDSVMRED